jgi:hypothetical protein
MMCLKPFQSTSLQLQDCFKKIKLMSVSQVQPAVSVRIWCDQKPRQKPKMDMFDYHQQSEFSTSSSRKFTPGPGFGVGEGRNTNFLIENTSPPDTTSMEMPLEYWSSSIVHGLASDAKVKFHQTLFVEARTSQNKAKQHFFYLLHFIFIASLGWLACTGMYA